MEYTVVRYLNGKEVTLDELREIGITNPTVLSICAAVRARAIREIKQRFDTEK